MKLGNTKKDFSLTTSSYSLDYNIDNPFYVGLKFTSGIGGDLFIASGCDRDDMIDELVSIDKPLIDEDSSSVKITFPAKTSLWQKAEYIFECLEDKIIYSYKVYGKGNLDNARYFEGFHENDPRRDRKFYPLFCGKSRETSHHRPYKYFSQSSRPDFDLIYTFSVNSSDTRSVMYYEHTKIRTAGNRFYLAGDWLVTPPPFLYLMGRRDMKDWVSLGLLVSPGENNFNEFHYRGGEGFGLDLCYDGYTEIDGSWQSPGMLIQQTQGEPYEALHKYCDYLRQAELAPVKDRSQTPMWWHEPIFGGWGEQVYQAKHWEDYINGRSKGWSGSSDQFCTQAAYEKMLETLESKDVDPTILIVDNRWFKKGYHLDVDTELWPNIKGFIADQHKKGRKVILWIAPWHHCRSENGLDVPVSESLILDKEKTYQLEIDTDVFYKACKRDMKKKRIDVEYEEFFREWTFFSDPQNPAYEKRIREKVDYLLSPDGLDADGFEFDYTHCMPVYRQMHPATEHKMLWGAEMLHHLLGIYYDQAKKAKPDSLIISHTFNPYFNDVLDMLRLQDIYTDNRSIVDQMHHRAKIAKAVCPDCAIHTDQHPMPSLEAWREYAKFQPSIGNPANYYVSGIETTREKLTDEDFKMLSDIWKKYRKELNERYERKTRKV